MTGTFAGYLIHIKVIDGFGGLGRMTGEYKEYRDSRDWSVRMLSFTDYLRQRFPNEWIAYQTYLRLINKDT
jgi:hypothetical protein